LKQLLVKKNFHIKIFFSIFFLFLAFTNKNRKSTLFNHLSSISEGIPALGWILISPTPAPHIKEMSDAAQFYTNRVLKDFKEKDPIHVEWAKQWLKILNELHAYVKQYHTTGLAWGTHSQRDSNVLARNPPPPPPPTSSFSNIQLGDNSSRNGIMSSINSLGTGATSHLKKVPDELKVHKNPQLKEQPIERSNKSQVNHFIKD
jgi:adenylyl cyclase-associated protein